MSAFLRFLAVALVAGSSLAAPIEGTVKDFFGTPIAAVTVAVGDLRGTQTNAEGAFSIDVPPGAYQVRFTHPSFVTESRTLRAGDAINIVMVSAFAETIDVSGIRATEEIPVTKTDITRQQIERRYHQQDIPLLLRRAPSVHAWAESGSGNSGYSYITLRGVSATRLNFTLDGVPLADSEDMGTYFVDFPDLAHSLQSIQIQRGVGTSTVGTPSFGGSVNLETVDLARREQTHLRLSAGSFGTRFGTLGYQSGELPGGFSLYSRFSYNTSDGFRDNAGIRQRNLFLSAAHRGESAQIRLTGFTAREQQQLSFYATDAETLRNDLRANPLRPEEKDSFGYDLAHLQYLRALNQNADLSASVYYQRGYGWYRLFDDRDAAQGLRQYGLDGMLLGAFLTMAERYGALRTHYGLHVNRFAREHTRDLVEGPRDYFNEGRKAEGNLFAKATYEKGPWTLYGDAQFRTTEFDYSGDQPIESKRWSFFNPKIGARYQLSATTSGYLSAGLSSREPARNDLFMGEDNPTVPHDLDMVKPERLLDLEAGFDLRLRAVALQANLYAMEFRNEIAATGELSAIGLPLRRNVDRSFRRGLELDATVEPGSAWRLRTIGSLSRNRIRGWRQSFDVYDEQGSWIGTRLRDYAGVQPLLTPSVLVEQSVDYFPTAGFSASLLGRYSGRSFLDNTNDPALITPSAFTLDGNMAVSLVRWMQTGNPRLSVQVNNLLDNRELFPSGYSYSFFTRSGGAETLSGIPYYYPQATRSVTVMLDFSL